MDPNDGKPGIIAGPAVMKLSDLRDRWGVVEPETWTQPPVLIQVKAMDYLETWRLVAAHPNDPPKTVLLNRYELIEKKRLPGAER